MNNGYAAFADARRGTGGEVDRVFDIAVFYKVNKFLRRHYRAVVLGFFRGRAEVRDNRHALHVQKFGRGEVGNIRVDFARLDCRDNVGIDAKLAARQVDYINAVFHFGNCLGVNQSARAVGQRYVQGDIVRVLEQVVEAVYLGYVVIELPCGVDGNKRVVTEHVHAQPHGIVADLNAYRAQPDHAERFAHNFATRKLLFAFFGLLGYVVAFKRFRPLHAVDYSARGEEQCGEAKFFYGVGVSAGGVKNNHAAIGIVRNGNIVYARARARYRDNRFGQRVVVHGERPKHNRDGRSRVFDKFVIFAERFLRERGYCVKFENIFHVCFLFRGGLRLVFLFEFFHKRDKRVHALRRHGVVNGSAHASYKPVSFERYQSVFRGLRDKLVVEIFAR